jgi:FAD/FMN-containing dehydrogenase
MPRGSATSLAGQTTNQALIIDFTKYFDKILEINPKERYAIVQPGVVRDQLNAAVKDLGLTFCSGSCYYQPSNYRWYDSQ